MVSPGGYGARAHYLGMDINRVQTLPKPVISTDGRVVSDGPSIAAWMLGPALLGATMPPDVEPVRARAIQFQTYPSNTDPAGRMSQLISEALVNRRA